MPKRTPNLDAPPLIYVDSCVYLDLITRNKQPHLETGQERGKAAYALFRAVDEGRVRLAASSLVQAEVGVNGKSHKNSEQIRQRLATWWMDPQTIWREVDRYLAREAIRLSITWQSKGINGNMSGADAVHLAAAIDLKCDYLFTYDHGFPHGHKVEGVQVMRPEPVWPETLLDLAVGE